MTKITDILQIEEKKKIITQTQKIVLDFIF